jgi:two-component sensor histidine kinase
MDQKLLYLLSLISFTFGALAFSVLVLMYFRQARRGRTVLWAFTVDCAVAFVTNLALQIPTLETADAWLISVLAMVQGLSTGLLPPLIFHLIYAKEVSYLPRRRAWGVLLVAFYAASAAAAIGELAEIADWLNSSGAISLGIGAGLALAAQSFSRRRIENHQRRWNQALLLAMGAGAALNLAAASQWASLLPDYVLLVFFSVTLYYEERLIFFDLLIKRGAFFAVALVGLPAILTIGFRAAGAPIDWTRCWICVLLLAPFWLIAPWLFEKIEASIDRGWLKRRYSVPEAEQRFIRDVQIAATEDDLRSRATASLCEIFQAPASVSFDAREQAVDPGGLTAPLIRIEPRPDGMPFLSDDHRLLQSISGTLGVVLENVRFREREHDLRWLATRAELKALRAQMNPHFLFNALNAIAGLIEEQPRLADETIEQLAHVLRYALRQSETEWVRLEEEIEFIAAYLRVEQARFGERLQVEFGIDRAAAAVPVPAMTIQPLVENAIKHGVSTLEEMGTVGVKAAIEDGLLCVAVSDNGPGFPSGFSIGSGGHGLRNVADRIAGYYGDCAQLSWENGSQGTRVVLKIPTTARLQGQA